jgi:hypothetical protein
MTGDTPSEPIRLLEIERELASPGAAAALARHDAVLSALDARLSRAVSEGLPPDEFSRAEELKKANTVARKILRLAVRDAKIPATATRKIY